MTSQIRSLLFFVLFVIGFAIAAVATPHITGDAWRLLARWWLLWMALTVIAVFLFSSLLHRKRYWLTHVLCFTLVTANLILIFSVCPMDVLQDFKGFAERRSGKLAIGDTRRDSDSPAVKFLIEENKKAVDEIKSRDEEEDNWFHNKFILVGGLLAATLGYIGFGKQPDTSIDTRMTLLSKSPSTMIILALACTIVLGIDLHVRNNLCQIDQLGLWIRYYVEPALLHSQPANVILPDDQFYGWEEFLRQTTPTDRHDFGFHWDRKVGISMHSDDLWNLTYEPHIHFLTAVVYLLYLGMFQWFAVQRTGSQSKFARRRLMAILCFWVVHTSFFAFAWIAHSAPEMFQFKVLPLANAFASGFIVPLFYFAPCAALIVLNIPYLLLYGRNLSPNRKSSNKVLEDTMPL